MISILTHCLSFGDHYIQKALANIQELGLKKIEWDNQDQETLHFKKYWEPHNRNIALCLSSMGPTMYCLPKTPEIVKEIVDKYPIKPVHFQTSEILNGVKQ